MNEGVGAVTYLLIMISVDQTIAPIRLYKVCWTKQKAQYRNINEMLSIPNESVDFIFSSHN